MNVQSNQDHHFSWGLFIYGVETTHSYRLRWSSGPFYKVRRTYLWKKPPFSCQSTMSVQSQAEIGSLSIHGLGAFTSILATLSADNVTPAAIVQMERLGAAILVNGPYAERCKDLMQRCSINQLRHLGLLVGWRKNDSVSLMADSAEGQAIALFSMCLLNIYDMDDIGRTLSQLSSTFLPGSMQIASVAQLASVAKVLGDKLNTIGFGNVLARNAMKLYQAYESLDAESPKDLLYQLNGQSIHELFTPIFQSLQEERMLCRIEGSMGMAYIVSMLQVLFPRSLNITVEGVIIQDVQCPKIYLAVKNADTMKPPEIRLESSVLHTGPVSLPISDTFSRFWSKKSRFTWSGCLADYLRLELLTYGLLTVRAYWMPLAMYY